MRVIAVVLAFVSLLVSGVLAVSVVRLRHDVDSLRKEVGELRSSASEDEPAGSSDRPPREPQARRLDSPPRLAPVALAPAAAPSENTAEVKQQVQRMVADELAQERERRQNVREQREALWRVQAATDLGLNEAEKERFLAVLAQEQNERRRLLDVERSGQKTFIELRPELDALRQRTQQSVRAILGDERMKQYEAMRPDRPGGFGRGTPPTPPASP